MASQSVAAAIESLNRLVSASSSFSSSSGTSAPSSVLSSEFVTIGSSLSRSPSGSFNPASLGSASRSQAPAPPAPHRPRERSDTSTAPLGWSHATNLHLLPNHAERLAVFGLVDFKFHLVSESDEANFLLSSDLRYFFWDQRSNNLRYVLTPYNLLGLYRAIDRRTEQLDFWTVPQEIKTPPTVQDIVHCPQAYKPTKWSNDKKRLIENQDLALSTHDIHRIQPILSHEDNEDVFNDREFFRSGGNYYLYEPMNGGLEQILHPDMSDRYRWCLLDEVPKFQSFRLVRVLRRDIEGGPRTLNPEDIPSNWTQNMVGQSLKNYMPRPDHWYHEPLTVISKKSPDGKTLHLIEDNETYVLWVGGTEIFTILEVPCGLPDILKGLKELERLQLQGG